MNVLELGVAVGVGLAFASPSIGFDMEVLSLQDLENGRRPNTVPFRGQLPG